MLPLLALRSPGDSTEASNVDWKYQREKAAKAAGRVAGKAAAAGGKAAVAGGKAAAKGAVKGAKVVAKAAAAGAKAGLNEMLGKHRSKGWYIEYEKTDDKAVTPRSGNVKTTTITWDAQTTGSPTPKDASGKPLTVTWLEDGSALATWFTIRRFIDELEIVFWYKKDNVSRLGAYYSINNPSVPKKHKNAEKIIGMIREALKASNQHSQLLEPGAYQPAAPPRAKKP